MSVIHMSVSVHVSLGFIVHTMAPWYFTKVTPLLKAWLNLAQYSKCGEKGMAHQTLLSGGKTVQINSQ